MEEDLPPEYHQELLVRIYTAGFAGMKVACVCKVGPIVSPFVRPVVSSSTLFPGIVLLSQVFCLPL